MRGEEILEAARRHKGSIQVEAKHRDILRFSLDGEWYGMNIEDVVEVIRNPRIFSIPHTPDYIIGVVNLKGEILSIIDIRRLLRLPTTPWDDEKYVVVVERDKVGVGIIVDKASDVVSVSDSAIKPALSTAGRAKGLIAGEVQLDGEVLAILDLDALMEQPTEF